MQSKLRGARWCRFVVSAKNDFSDLTNSRLVKPASDSVHIFQNVVDFKRSFIAFSAAIVADVVRDSAVEGDVNVESTFGCVPLPLANECTLLVTNALYKSRASFAEIPVVGEEAVIQVDQIECFFAELTTDTCDRRLVVGFHLLRQQDTVSAVIDCVSKNLMANLLRQVEKVGELIRRLDWKEVFF